MFSPYLLSIQLIERLHRQFLEVVKAELESLSVMDINNVQALILSNIGVDQLTVGELTQRGYYQGSNVSYNVKKMVENGYLVQEPSPHDKRSVRVKLSPKGLDLSKKISGMYDRHLQKLKADGLLDDDLKEALAVFGDLGDFWKDELSKTGFTFDSDEGF